MTNDRIERMKADAAASTDERRETTRTELSPDEMKRRQIVAKAVKLGIAVPATLVLFRGKEAAAIGEGVSGEDF